MTHVIGTAGHVDHGKSTLVKALTGIDPDRLAEEKAREMTIDLGFAWLSLPGGETVGLIDVPGHRDFIENMLAGIGGIDLALFVIAADEGVMPQTREHLIILDLLEIAGGVVALTKIDTITDPEWLDLITADIADTLRGTVLAGAPIVPVSAKTGEGLDRLAVTLETALTLCPPRPDRDRPSLPIDRVFTVSGFGTVVTGTLSGGSLHTGEEVEIVPRGLQTRIRGLQSHKEAIEVARPGNRIAVNLTGMAREDLQRGDILTRPGLLSPTTLIDTRFRHVADSEHPLKHNTPVKLFCGAAETQAHVRLLGDQELAPGSEGWLQLRLETPLALDRGDRFILRYPSPSRTLGGGSVLDPHPAHRWRRFKPEVLARLHTLATGTPAERLLDVLENQIALTATQAAKLADLDDEETRQTLADLLAHNTVIDLGEGWFMSRQTWNRLLERISQELGDFHLAHPLRPGMPREALRSRLEIDARLFARLIDRVSEANILKDTGTLVHHPDHAIRFSARQQQGIDQLWAAIRRNRFTPPGVAEAIALVEEDVYQALVGQGQLIQVSPDVLFDTPTYHQMIDAIKTFIQANGSITVAQTRDLFNTSRKYALALLEYTDSAGITLRTGDERILKK